MDAANRAIIAYIAGHLITGPGNWWLHDHDRRRKVQFEASFEPGTVKVYSHELHSHVIGVGSEGKYALFQHGIAGAVDLLVDVEERTFSGWDHPSSCHFHGTVEENIITLYDFQDLKWHKYTL